MFKKKGIMNITQIMNAGTNVQIVVGLADLKEFAQTLLSEREQEKKASGPASEIYLTQDEAAARLKVDKSTLWRWDKSGYLRKCRVGGKVRYRLREITELLEG